MGFLPLPLNAWALHVLIPVSLSLVLVPLKLALDQRLVIFLLGGLLANRLWVRMVMNRPLPVVLPLVPHVFPL